MVGFAYWLEFPVGWSPLLESIAKPRGSCICGASPLKPSEWPDAGWRGIFLAIKLCNHRTGLKPTRRMTRIFFEGEINV